MTSTTEGLLAESELASVTFKQGNFFLLLLRKRGHILLTQQNFVLWSNFCPTLYNPQNQRLIILGLLSLLRDLIDFEQLLKFEHEKEMITMFSVLPFRYCSCVNGVHKPTLTMNNGVFFSWSDFTCFVFA